MREPRYLALSSQDTEWWADLGTYWAGSSALGQSHGHPVFAAVPDGGAGRAVRSLGHRARGLAQGRGVGA